MCGIVGALTFDAFEKKSEEKTRTEANIFITTQLLQATVERGKDATGVALLWADGNFLGLKMGLPSPDFIARFGNTEKDFEGFLKLWREYPKLMKIFLGHCRKSSVGNSYDNKNNHPIQVGNIVMVHNGTLTNHDKIFDKLDCKRTGDVDSEAIGRLLHHYSKGGEEPFTTEMLEETTRRLHGTYSVLAMAGNNPYQVAQFRDGRPAEMVLVRPLRTVYIASEKKYLENVLFEYNKMSKLFAASVKFPYLKQADVDFKTLPDDSVALWDLTVPITDKTDIADLYDWKKTPLRVDKIWSETSTSTNNSTWNSNRSSTEKKSNTGTEVNAQNRKTGQDSPGDDDDKDNSNGLVWSKSLSKYKTQDGIEETKKYGAVKIDVENAEVIPLDSDDDEDGEIVDLKEVGKDGVENLIVGCAETKELALKRVENAAEIASSGAKKSSSSDSKRDTNKNSGTTVEIDMTSHPEALKKAEEFTDKSFVKYEDDEEVASDLDISDPSVLRPLPLYALANRIKKFIFKQGFVAGYISKERPDYKQETAERKLVSAENKIRVLKLIIKILAKMLEYRTKGNSPAAVNNLIVQSVSDIQPAKLSISTALTVGDVKNMPILKQLGGLLEGKK